LRLAPAGDTLTRRREAVESLDLVAFGYHADTMTTDNGSEKRRSLAIAEAVVVRLRAQHDLLMNAFKFDEARDLVVQIEAAERERASLAALVPAASAETAPLPNFRRRPPLRRRRR
jgi:hypothetical protein